MTTTIEPALDSRHDAAQTSSPSDVVMPIPERRRTPRRVLPLIAVLAVLLALGGAVASVHMQANARAEQARELDGKASSERASADELKQSAGTKAAELADLTQKIDSARADIAKKEPLQ